MATIRFTAAERPKLLARAVLAVTSHDMEADDVERLVELAQAFLHGPASTFDGRLVDNFPDVALAASGLGPATHGVDPETGGEAAVER